MSGILTYTSCMRTSGGEEGEEEEEGMGGERVWLLGCASGSLSSRFLLSVSPPFVVSSVPFVFSVSFSSSSSSSSSVLSFGSFVVPFVVSCCSAFLE
jgi:hypothetical protein